MRKLQAMAQVIGLEVEEFQLRNGSDVCPRGPAAADVRWDLERPAGGTWTTTGDAWTARATLPRGFLVDDRFDVVANGARWVRTATLEASGVRAWYRIELAADEPADTAVLYRLWDGSEELWWTGLDWEAAEPDDLDQWNTAEELAAGFPSLSGAVRELAVVAWLSTDTATAAPSFYGFKVGYGVASISSLDDALIRTLLASLQGDLRAVAVSEFSTRAELAALTLPGDEWQYEVTAVDAVFDLTDDPDELEELPGVFASGVWTPTDPIPADHVVRVEMRYKPDITVRRHQDAEELATLPAVYIAPSGPPSKVVQGQDLIEIRDLAASPPTAWTLLAPELVELPLQVRAVADLGADTDRLADALRAWLGDGGMRRLISPVTGALISVQDVTPAIWGADLLSQGVSEARSSWLLRYAQARAALATTTTLIREGGTSIDIGD